MDTEMKIYTISLDNYHGETYEEHYFQRKHALARFLELRDEGKAQYEFEFCQNFFMFFDPSYNEYSTRIVLTDGTLKSLFMDDME